MELLFNSVKQWVQAQGVSGTYWVGYSGGLDSHVLLHLLSRIRACFPIPLRAVYIHHGLNPQATAWAAHAASVCEGLQVDFISHAVNAAPVLGDSPEEAARIARYRALKQLVVPNDVLLTAHHQNDQAETLLLQLVRGAGPKGLSAMPSIKRFGQGYHGRPLLPFNRDTVQEYAIQHGLHWIEDESNRNTGFHRNFLRHEVIPLLETRWPSVRQTLARAAGHCAEAQSFIENWAEKHLCKVQDETTNTLSVEQLLLLDAVQQCHVLRRWFSLQHIPLPSAAKMRQILHAILHAKQDRVPCVAWAAVELRRYRGKLFMMKKAADPNPTEEWSWVLSEPLEMVHGTLRASLDRHAGLLRADKLQKVTVTFRQGGERCHLPGRQCHHALKKLLSVWGVPPWQRNRLPLLYVNNQLAVIPGYFVAQNFITQSTELGWTIHFSEKN